ncbi:MAG: glycosyltransferase [Clostridia bacterium]
MKICILNSVCYGSTGKIACNTARVLNAAGHEAIIFYGRGIGPSDVPCQRIECSFEIAAHVAKARLFDRSGFGSVLATIRLIMRLNKLDPDIIHLHNIHGYWIHIGMLFRYLKRAGKPVVWTLHDCWPFTGHCPYFDFVACERWKTGCGHCPQKNEYPERWLLDNSARNYIDKRRLFTHVPDLTIVTPSIWLSQLVKQSFLSEYAVSVLPNGIDLSVFCPTERGMRGCYGLTDGRLILGVANIWEPRKGLHTFFKLREMLPKEHQIVLVGLSEEQCAAVPDGILGLPRTGSTEELAAWYTAADVLVDSTLEENFPTTHLEALACGTPVATYQTGGSAEMLTQFCGISVPTGDVEALAHAIDTACALSSEDCLLRAREYDQNLRLAAYENLYASALSRAKQQRKDTL